jgi:hypothetical protein
MHDIIQAEGRTLTLLLGRKYDTLSCAKQANPADLRGSLRFKISNKQRNLP